MPLQGRAAWLPLLLSFTVLSLLPAPGHSKSFPALRLLADPSSFEGVSRWNIPRWAQDVIKHRGGSSSADDFKSKVRELMHYGWDETEAVEGLQQTDGDVAAAAEVLASGEEALILKRTDAALATLRALPGFDDDFASEDFAKLAIKQALGNSTVARELFKEEMGAFRSQMDKAVARMVGNGWDAEEAKETLKREQIQRRNGEKVENSVDMPPPVDRDDVFYNVTMNSFQSMVMNSPVPVVIDIHASWCGPCKALNPILEDVVMRAGGQFRVARVDADVERELVEALEVKALPTVFVVSGCQIIDSFVGVPTQEDLQQFLMRLVMDVPRPETTEIAANETGHTDVQLKALSRSLANVVGMAALSFDRKEKVETDVEIYLEQLESQLQDYLKGDVTVDGQAAKVPHNLVQGSLSESVGVILMYLKNLEADIINPRYRNISMTNKVFTEKVAPHSAAHSLLGVAGYRVDPLNENFLVVKHRNAAAITLMVNKIKYWLSQATIRRKHVILKEEKERKAVAAAADAAKSATTVVPKKVIVPGMCQMAVRIVAANGTCVQVWRQEVNVVHTTLADVMALLRSQFPTVLPSRAMVSSTAFNAVEGDASWEETLASRGCGAAVTLVVRPLEMEAAPSSRSNQSAAAVANPFQGRTDAKASGQVHTMLSEGILDRPEGKGNEYFGGDSTVFEIAVDSDDEKEEEEAVAHTPESSDATEEAVAGEEVEENDATEEEIVDEEVEEEEQEDATEEEMSEEEEEEEDSTVEEMSEEEEEEEDSTEEDDSDDDDDEYTEEEEESS